MGNGERVMGWRIKGTEEGFTLMQLSLALVSVVILALVVPPVTATWVNGARMARARRDVERISVAIQRFRQDVGFYPWWIAAAESGRRVDDRLDLLISPGNIPEVATDRGWLTGKTDLLVNQLVENKPGYLRAKAATSRGWKGPYLPSEVGPDPWGNRYIVTIGMALETPATDRQIPEIRAAVWILSAGPNGIIDTLYLQAASVAELAGDDVGTVVRPSSPR